eukprot:1548972-Rhodomonas_salina.1
MAVLKKIRAEADHANRARTFQEGVVKDWTAYNDKDPGATKRRSCLRTAIQRRDTAGMALPVVMDQDPIRGHARLATDKSEIDATITALLQVHDAAMSDDAFFVNLIAHDTICDVADVTALFRIHTPD